LLFLDLDGFKQINDSLGHAEGDALLQVTARRLVQSLRASDTVARVGGDEFVVLLDGLQRPEDALRIAEKLRHAVSQPMTLGGRQVQVSPSIGIAHFPGDGDDERALLHAADMAMYLVKRSGGNRSAAAPQEPVPGGNENGRPKAPVPV
jgi:diguanylate cyclase (GGDEF)-like protein